MLTDKEIKVLFLRHQGLQQREIAKILGTTQGAVSRFEANAKEKIVEAQRQLALLRKLGVEPSADETGLEQELKALKDRLRRKS